MKSAALKNVFLLACCCTLLPPAAAQKPRQGKVAPATTADKWSDTIVSLLTTGHHDLLEITDTQLHSKLKPLIPSITKDNIDGASPENGITHLTAGFQKGSVPPTLNWLEIEMPRTDPQGRELFPCLARRFSLRLAGTRWKLFGKIAGGSAVWVNGAAGFGLTLTDTGTAITLKLHMDEDGYHDR